MATNLHNLASAQLIELEAAAAEIAAAQAAQRDELDRRADSPSPVTAMQNWVTECGAAQHLSVASAALNENRAAQQVARDEIAAIANPADAETHEDELRALLITEAALRVEARLATERKAAAQHALDTIADLKSAADTEVAGATELVVWAEALTERTDALRAAVLDPEIAGTEALATNMLTSLERGDADARLNALLPTVLRDRAEARFAEAAALTAAAEAQAAIALDAADQLAIDAQKYDGPLRVAARDLATAESELAELVSSAVSQLGRAETLYASIAAHEGLSPAQIAALDAAANADGVTATGLETAVADAVEAVREKQHDVDNAVLNVQSSDIDADPAADAAVIAAEAALADAAIQDPLATARAAYDAAAQLAIDEWEVEVPPTLWTALLDFAIADRVLTELGDGTARGLLNTALDDSEDDFAKAVEDRNKALRAEWAVELVYATRSSTLVSLDSAAAARDQQYLQGDGPAGRTPAEL